MNIVAQDDDLFHRIKVILQNVIRVVYHGTSYRSPIRAAAYGDLRLIVADRNKYASVGHHDGRYKSLITMMDAAVVHSYAARSELECYQLLNLDIPRAVMEISHASVESVRIFAETFLRSIEVFEANLLHVPEESKENAEGVAPTDRQPMKTVPKDGRFVELLIDYSDGYNPLQDATIAWTIGSNDFDNTGVDEWKILGWLWSQDHFSEGMGKLLAWRPSSLNEKVESPVEEASA